MDESDPNIAGEITSRETFANPRPKQSAPQAGINRRDFLRYSVAGTGAAALSGAGWQAFAGEGDHAGILNVPFMRKEIFPAKRNPKFTATADTLTDRLAAAAHNNFYEFRPGRGGKVYRTRAGRRRKVIG